MAINALSVQWLARLANAGVLPKGGSWIELGPQDFVEGHVTLDVLHHALDPIIGSDNGVWRLFADASRPSVTKTMLLYQCLGAGDYAALDLNDSRAEFRFDLNYSFDIPKQFDVLTNFGTSEHCFNIAESFRTCHRLLRAGGIGLYVLPAFGDINHGLYNVHPIIYPLIAASNDYEMVDLLYIDDIAHRSGDASAHAHVDFDFSNLPINLLNTMFNRSAFSRAVMNNFIANCAKHRDTADPDVLDYCFVAMRKRSDAAFVFPQQP